MDNSEYLVFRYFIIPTSPQVSLYHQTGEKKEDIIHNQFRLINSLKKIDFIHRGDRFIIFSVKEYNDDLFFFKIAKEHRLKQYKEGEEKVIEENVERIEVVNLICQKSTQLIMIQKDTTAFSEVSTPINAFEKYLQKVVYEYDYTLVIDEKPSENMFWDYVNNSKSIYSLELKFNALNINLGGPDIRKSIKELSNVFNNDEVEVKLKNKDGNLKLLKKSISKYIEYISLLGGKYRLVFKGQNGIRKAIDSMSNIIKFRFLRKIEDEDPKKIEQKLKDISDKKDVDQG